jgi:hypothetical protein
LGGVIHLIDECIEKEEQANQYQSKYSHDPLPTFRPQLGTHLMATKISNGTKANTSKNVMSSSSNPRTQIRKKKPIHRHDISAKHNGGHTSFGDSLIFANKKQSKNKSSAKTIKLQERIGNGEGSVKNSIRRMDSNISDLEYVDNTQTDIDFFDAKTRQKWNQCKRRASQKERKIDDNPSDSGMPVFEHFPIRELTKDDLDVNSQKNFDRECQKLVQSFVNRKSVRPGNGKTPNSKPVLLPRLPINRQPSSPSVNKNLKKSSTILNDQLRQQIQLQDLHSNNYEE